MTLQGEKAKVPEMDLKPYLGPCGLPLSGVPTPLTKPLYTVLRKCRLNCVHLNSRNEAAAHL